MQMSNPDEGYQIMPSSYTFYTQLAIERITPYANAPLAISLLTNMSKALEIINQHGGVPKNVWEEIKDATS